MIVVEVMGRDAGWIAYASGIAGGAHVILVPEKEIDIDHVCALLKYNYDHGKHYGVVVVAEGCHLPEVGQVADVHRRWIPLAMRGFRASARRWPT